MIDMQCLCVDPSLAWDPVYEHDTIERDLESEFVLDRVSLSLSGYFRRSRAVQRHSVCL